MRSLHSHSEGRVLGLVLSAVLLGAVLGNCAEAGTARGEMAGAGSSDAANQLVVIVNKASAVFSLSSRDLRSIFLGVKDSWPDGKKIAAVSLPVERPETQLLLKEICGMSESDFKRYFLMMNFQGKSVSPPRVMLSPSAVRAFVRSTPGGVGVIRASDVDSSVAVISIDGISPGATGYKLAIAH